MYKEYKTNMSSFEKFQKFLTILLIAAGCFYGGFYMGKRGFVFEIRKNPPEISVINKYPAKQTIDFGLFWEVWDLLNSTYLERPVDNEQMLYGAISGMVNALGDPYTSFLPPEVNEAMNSALNGKYQGIGAELGMRDNQMIIVSPLDGSPAKAAGLKVGDKLLEIEGESTYGLNVNDAVLKIRGEAGTVSTLTIQTGDDTPREMKITRGVISISSVTWEDKGDGTAYIRVSRFGDETNKDWDKAVGEISVQMKELDAVVVDVRGNPGGYLQSAVYLAGEFFRNKVVLYEETSTGEQIPLETKRVGAFEKVPAIYVLIDEGSASASEILAGALKSNRGETVLVGKKSFGKGTIQDAKEFKDGSGVHITIAKWLTPAKLWVHKNGITPDVEVEITEDNITNKYDSQLEKALELAKQI